MRAEKSADRRTAFCLYMVYIYVYIYYIYTHIYIYIYIYIYVYACIIITTIHIYNSGLLLQGPHTCDAAN